MNVGDRVKITNPEHPWYGNVGTVYEPFVARLRVRGRPAAEGWLVMLDAYRGTKTVAKDSDVQVLTN